MQWSDLYHTFYPCCSFIVIKHCLIVYDCIHSLIKYLLNIQIANKHMGRCSVLLVVRPLHMRYHFTPIRITNIKQQVLVMMWTNWNPHLMLVGGLSHFIKTVWLFLKMLNIELPYNPEVLLLGIYPKEWSTYVQTKPYPWLCIAAFL